MSTGLKSRLLEQTLVYRVWMAPQTSRKFAPIRAHNDLASVARVLDVGCGPGTNTSQFAAASDYLGLDINPQYIEDARRRHKREFRAVDVTSYEVDDAGRFDFILINSFLHHLPTDDVRRILEHLRGLLTDDGHVHMLELVMPQRPSVARQLAKWDRGRYARSLDEWRALFSEIFAIDVFEPYHVGIADLTLWNMIYCKAGLAATTS